MFSSSTDSVVLQIDSDYDKFEVSLETVCDIKNILLNCLSCAFLCWNIQIWKFSSIFENEADAQQPSLV